MTTSNREESRRTFLNRACLALGGVAAAIVGVPIVGYLLTPLIKSSQSAWRDVGAVDNFAVGTTVEVAFDEPSPLPWAGQAAKTAAWLRRTDDGFTAFAVNCTHLGCPVNWLADAKLFLCPCHGGVFYADGKVAGGPPQRPLWTQPVRVRNGRVEILTRPLQVA
ncbi:MAG TPA: ubiquinol-cytochrome c reductase iron-sulfur subunit [Thermomicrobiales bacterium]